jgi:23S rRNA (guanosine2251-2'-O)-methyltransferase
MIIVLDNIRSIFNVGAIFRTADSVGAEKLILGGYTPSPPMDKLHKTALGAVDYVSWEKYNNEELIEHLQALKDSSYKIVSIEQSSNSISLLDSDSILGEEKVVCIFGNEIVGVSKELLNISDYVIEIPMYGKKNSLNVSVTVGIIVYLAKKLNESKR